jgi:membrane protease YdiL (CAAX protease family)
LITPFALLPSTALVFGYASQSLGSASGYLLGFAFYWLFWCLIFPLLVLGRREFSSLLKDQSPLFARPNWGPALLWIVITVVTIFTYGGEFIDAAAGLILLSIPLATINGVCEEILWRGLYVRVFPKNLWLGILFPAIGFALWHFAPAQVFYEGNTAAFIVSTFFLGLAYGFIAYRCGSARWTAISHSINGVLALSGMLAPSLVKLLSQ